MGPIQVNTPNSHMIYPITGCFHALQSLVPRTTHSTEQICAWNSSGKRWSGSSSDMAWPGLIDMDTEEGGMFPIHSRIRADVFLGRGRA